MALTTYRAICSIGADTALPEDACVNVLHFRGFDSTTSKVQDSQEIVTQLQTFYQSFDQDLYSPVINGLMTVDTYDLGDASPRVPVHTDTIALTPNAASVLPPEVAVTLSFQATPISGGIQARRRGRIYLGPVSGAAVSGPTAGRIEVNPTVVTALVGAAEQLMEDSIASAQVWCVYSPTTHATSSLAAASFLVEEGWVDNAFDTMRSRGTGATARTLWP